MESPGPFTDGVAIGSKSFIEHLFRERRECFGHKRRNGARPIVEAHTNLCSIRALRVQAVERAGQNTTLRRTGIIRPEGRGTGLL